MQNQQIIDDLAAAKAHYQRLADTAVARWGRDRLNGAGMALTLEGGREHIDPDLLATLSELDDAAKEIETFERQIADADAMADAHRSAKVE